jgi:Activator of Hsp90 ATPase homolog 1-like protein
MDLSPIEHEYALRCPPDHAFATFTGRIGEWWHPDYSPDAENLEDTVMEPEIGGRVYFVVLDLGELQWGTVTAWEPGQHVAFSSTLAQSREFPSEISAEFTATEDGCRMRFQHGGWTAGNAADRHKFSDWRLILDRFAALAQA